MTAVRDPLPARLGGPRAVVAAQAEAAQQPADGQGVHARPEHAEDRGQEGEARRPSEPTTIAPPSPIEVSAVAWNQQQPGQPDRDRDAREEDGLAGGPDRTLDRLLDRASARSSSRNGW